MIPWRLFWVVLGGVLTAAGAVAFTRWVPVFPSLLLATLAGVLAVAVSRAILLNTATLATMPMAGRRALATLVAFLAGLHTMWVMVFRVSPPETWVWLLVGLFVGVVVEYAGVTFAEHLVRNRPVPVHGGSNDEDHTDKVMAAALLRAGFGHLKVLGHTVLGGDDDPYGLEFLLSLPAGKESPGNTAGEKIANGLREILKTPMRTGWVTLRKTPEAGTYNLTVLLRDVMADVINFQDDPTPTSITRPALVGYEVNRKPHYLSLTQHGQDIGKSRWGKSSLIHVKLAHITRCTDAVAWVCGTQKLYDLVAGWIEPYDGTDYPIPIDWICSGPADTLEMLCAGMRVARWRQRQPMSQRNGYQDIIIVLDEASFALENNSVRAAFEGQLVTMSHMAAMLSKGAGSGKVWLLRATQRSTQDHAGDHGGDVGTNVGYSCAFNSADWAEVGRLTGCYDLPMPSHRGEYWLNDTGGTDDGPVLLKAPYIQEVDPSKPKLHSGATVSQVAWERRHLHSTLDPGSTMAAGDAYRLRPTKMDDELREYLTGEPAPPPEPGASAPGGGPLTPYEQGYAAVMASLADIPAQQAAPAAANAPGVATIVGRKTRADRIRDIIEAADSPLSPREILAELPNHGDRTDSYQAVINELIKLVTAGHVIKLDRGQYVSTTHNQTHNTPGTGVTDDAAGQTPG